MPAYLLVLPDRDDAEALAEDLAVELEDELGEVRVVREALSGEDDAEDHDWAVHVQVAGDDDGSLATGLGRLRSRLSALAEEYGGWLDPEPW